MCVVPFFLNNRTARSSDAIVFALAFFYKEFTPLQVRKCITGFLLIKCGLNRVEWLATLITVMLCRLMHMNMYFHLQNYKTVPNNCGMYVFEIYTVCMPIIANTALSA